MSKYMRDKNRRRLSTGHNSPKSPYDVQRNNEIVRFIPTK